MKITGLDKLQKNLTEAQRALAAIDGDIGRVSFTPDDPSSIQAAIQQMENMIDQKVGQYASNPIVAPLISASKEAYREAILKKAATARLQNDTDE